MRRLLPEKGINMSELQTEAQDDLSVGDIHQEQEVEQTGTVENGVDLASTSDEQHESNQESPEVQENDPSRFAERMNKKHGEMMEANRRAEAAEARNREFELQQQQQAIPTVPDKPEDVFADDYEIKLAEWQKGVQASATYEAQQNIVRQQEQQNAYLQQQKQVEKQSEQVNSYKQRAAKVGISEAELVDDANTVVAFGLRNDISMQLLGDVDGALITKYLKSNPSQIEAINNMDAYSLGSYVEQKIRPEAVKFKPRTTNAPPPADNLQGNGVNPEAGKFKHIKGAKFE